MMRKLMPGHREDVRTIRPTLTPLVPAVEPVAVPTALVQPAPLPPHPHHWTSAGIRTVLAAPGITVSVYLGPQHRVSVEVVKDGTMVHRYQA
jgi:hypothetical protein